MATSATSMGECGPAMREPRYSSSIDINLKHCRIGMGFLLYTSPLENVRHCKNESVI